jgi:hypothetical protein
VPRATEANPETQAHKTTPGPKRYDRAYFDRWYRRAGTRVHVGASVARKVRLAVHAAEHLIERPIRRVLDVGCGPAPAIAPGLEALAGRLAGVAFIEVFTAADSITGDRSGLQRRAPEWYARAFRRAGLVHCGLCCFVREDFAPGLATFERGWR